MGGLLKLRAADEEDLAVIAACLQDALVPIGDVAFLPQDRRFVLVANRFRWEAGEPAAPVENAVEDGPGDAPFSSEPGPRYERTNCGLWFENVRAVHTKGIDLHDRGCILELLTLRKDDGSAVLIFAGDAMIRLEIDGLRCFLEDIGRTWPTRWRPAHPAAEEGPQP
jgi:hypothetical protein